MQRRVLLTSALAAALASLAGPAPARAQADGEGEPPEGMAGDGAATEASVEAALAAPLSLHALDVLGTINFADAMGGIAVQGESILQKVLGRLGVGAHHGHGGAHGADDEGGDHAHAFPLANLTVAAGLNALRATMFGPEVRHHTLHELETTLIGVAMLLGLTSVAKGIVASEGSAMQMVDRDDVTIRRDPEEALVDSIFQLTIVSAATQIPLSSFGNAAIGNQEFRDVRVAFSAMYARLLPPPPASDGEVEDRDALVAHVVEQLAARDNPVVRRQVERILTDPDVRTRADLAAALQRAATWHTHDLMTILMSTSCDDSQAALGDPGPLVGLYQTYGVEFLQALPALVPYTIAIGFERALFAMRRAGLKRPIFTRAKWAYLARFLRETWRNLVVYFATVAPEISSKITGTRRATKRRVIDGEEVGVTFSVLEQVLQDIEGIITTFMDPFLNDQVLDERKVRRAVGDLQDAMRQWHEALGRRAARGLFPPRPGSEGETVVTRADALADQAAIVGEKESGSAPYPYRKDAPVGTLKDLQIRLASIVDEPGIERFAAELRDIRRRLGPQLEREIREELARQGGKPTVLTALEVLRKNPRLRDLVDINYWHGRVGPALTDTLFVVLLQGLHLPFLLSTSELVIYDARWFKSMPLVSREVVSVLYNNALGLFADNWADCVAHAKWLTNMYLSDLRTQLQGLAGEFPEIATALRSRHMRDDATRIIPERLKTNAEQVAALFAVLQRRHPDAAPRLQAALDGYLDTLERFYFKSMVMAMTISVVGAGKSLPGDSTHFTFAAGEKDFTLAVTLLDFKRHPLYHVWELVFSGAYAMLLGPWLAQHGVAPIFARLGAGTGAVAAMQGLAQAGFRRAYPGMAERFQQLEDELAQGAAGEAPRAE